MAFVQIIEFRTSKPEEFRALGEEWEQASAGQRTTSRRVTCQDRDDSSRYLNIVFFESYEDAMKNSELPVTQEFASKMMALADGPPTFTNLDVVEDSSS
jgi:quinol monooxygenase YgiN